MTKTTLVPRVPASLPREQVIRIIPFRKPWLRFLLGAVVRGTAWLVATLLSGLGWAINKSPQTVIRVLLGG